jgi:hypothetical protein
MPGVFISYRRDDSSGYAGRLYDALVTHFGSDLVFIDIDSIRAGENFADVIDKGIAAYSVVVVLIGKGWLKSVDDQGDRRLDDPHDFVRLEIASALAQTIPVIPVLVAGAKMPRSDDLPKPLKLQRLQASEEIMNSPHFFAVTFPRPPLIYLLQNCRRFFNGLINEKIFTRVRLGQRVCGRRKASLTAWSSRREPRPANCRISWSLLGRPTSELLLALSDERADCRRLVHGVFGMTLASFEKLNS